MDIPKYKKWQTKYLIQEYVGRHVIDIKAKDELEKAITERGIDLDEMDKDVKDFCADMRDKYLRTPNKDKIK